VGCKYKGINKPVKIVEIFFCCLLATTLFGKENVANDF